MQVLLLPQSYPPVLGGLQTVTEQIAEGLTGRGHSVRVVTNRYPRALPARETRGGVRIERDLFLTPTVDDLRRQRFDLFGASLYVFPATLAHLVHVMRTFRPDVVNVHFPDGQIPFVLLLRRWFKFRLVVSLHGDDVERWFGRCSGSEVRSAPRPGAVSVAERLRCILNEADAVTACSSYLLGRAITLAPSVAEKGAAIPNGIDPERFRDVTPYPHPRPYVLAYGRFTYKKGFDLLLEAFGRLAPTHADVDLILAGDGEERRTLQEQAQALRLTGRAHFFGRATPQAVVRLLNGCRFVVIPSRQEPFGIVALEALAAGKPVMATRVGGLPELVQGVGTQLVLPTSEGITAGIAQWLHEWSAKGSLSTPPPLSTDLYSWDRMATDYEQVYSGVLS